MPTSAANTAPRPTLAAAKSYDTPHLRVHYAQSGADAPPAADENQNGVPDYVELIAAAGERSWRVLIEELAWPPPAPDADLGGDLRTDIYVRDLGGAYLGWSARDNRSCGDNPRTPQRERVACSAFLSIHNHLRRPGLDSSDLIQLSVAHEFMHIVQHGIDSAEPADWMWEAWAVWAEEQVFDEINAYLHFLPPLFAAPESSFESYPYAAAVLPLWLGEQFGPALARDVWLAAIEADGVQALDAALRRRQLSLRRVLLDYGVALAVRAPCPALAPYCWQEGEAFPAAAVQGSLSAPARWESGAGQSLHPLGRTILRLQTDAAARVRLSTRNRGQAMTLQVLQLRAGARPRLRLFEAITQAGVAEITLPPPGPDETQSILITPSLTGGGIGFVVEVEALAELPLFLPLMMRR